MTLKLIIWDMDGTLVDSREVIQTAMVRAFDEHNLPSPAYEETRKTVGLGLSEACARLVPETFDMAKLPALVAALEARRDEGCLQAIATGRARRGIDAICEMHAGLKDFFDTTWSADDGPCKPHPFMVDAAMDALGVTPDQAVMVGDATFDILMGRAAKVHTLGVSWGFGRADELDAAGAHRIHHTFETLNQDLAQFSPPDWKSASA